MGAAPTKDKGDKGGASLLCLQVKGVSPGRHIVSMYGAPTSES